MDHDPFIAELERKHQRGESPGRREPVHKPLPTHDEQVCAGDWRLGLFLLAEHHAELVRTYSRLRRARLVEEHPLHGVDLRDVAQRVIGATQDLAAALLPPSPDGDWDARRDRVVSLLNGLAPAAGDAYLEAVEAAGDAMLDVEALEVLPTPQGDGDYLAQRALFHRACGAGRAALILSLAGHLMAMDVRPGIALGLLEAFDRDRCQPPLGGDEVERLLRYCARKQAERLEGLAA